MCKRILYALGAALVATASGSANDLTVPFTEDFGSNGAGWLNNASAAVTFETSGGPDGGSHVSTSFNYFGFSNPFGGGPVIFRANDAANASGDAFVGDWTAGGVVERAPGSTTRPARTWRSSCAWPRVSTSRGP